jgi:hypothetical protein
MGHGAHGTIPQRARLRWLAALASVCCVCGGNVNSAAVVHAAGLPALTVYANQPTVRTSLRLQPGYALIIRTDHEIDTVAIGDPRIVSAAPVRRGRDVFDVVVQPQADAGKTNMVIWLGDVTAIWDLEVGPSRRTADVVFVVTQSRAVQNGARGTDTRDAQGSANAPAPHTASRTGASPTTRAPHDGAPPERASTQPQPGSDSTRRGSASNTAPPTSTIELSETEGPVKATFRAARTKNGIVLRYQITNGSDADVAVTPRAVLVRADGRAVAFGMLRGSVGRDKPNLIPQGATETGMIDIATPAAREIELILSLFPASTAGHETPASGTLIKPETFAGTVSPDRLPFVFQITFSGLDRLPVAALF